MITMAMEREKWIEATLHSADSMSRVGAPDLVASVYARIGGRQVTMTVTTGTLWRIAASIILLIGLNITTLVSHHAIGGGAPHTASEALLGSGGSQADMGELFFGSEGMSNE